MRPLVGVVRWRGAFAELKRYPHFVANIDGFDLQSQPYFQPLA